MTKRENLPAENYFNPKNPALALICASLARLGESTLKQIQHDLKEHGVSLAESTLRVYLYRMFHAYLIDKFDDGVRDTSKGEYVTHKISEKGMELLEQWQNAIRAN